MSVAWYPIYRIPTGRSPRRPERVFPDVSRLSTARAVTREELWEKSEGAGRKEPGTARMETGIPGARRGSTRWGAPPPPISAHGERVIRTRAEKISSGAAPREVAGAQLAAYGGGTPVRREYFSRLRATPTPLRAFGLSYYKLRGEMWHAKEVADWLAMMTDGAPRG